MHSASIADILRRAVVIPVLTIERAEDAVPLGRALVEGGLTVLEITLRTDVACEAIRRMKAEVDGAVIGAGTLLNVRDLDRAQEAGAEFFVSPGLGDSLTRAAIDRGAAYLPGVATATEMLRGLDLGLTHFKFFPAEQLGGPAALKAFAGPLPQCRFCPTGGITEENATSYLALDNVVCTGGVWMASSDLVDAKNWREITARACKSAVLR
ncbi:MAG TPA: bifunctional 4-hydroxy-2-oxoglutarate aldolase/2-dehydro-3-deoxy-phosphogluconate aldolase [Rhizomicrobium sp.]